MPVAQRVSIIGSTTSVGAPTWRDDELQAFEKHFLEEGVISGLAVSQHAAGANMQVDVAVGHALIQITNTNLSAGETYLVYFRNLALEEVTVPTADATNPRIDRLVAEVLVNTDPNAASSNVGQLRLITGTPAGSPSAPAEPSNAITLALISVPASDTTISTGQITDSRTYVTVDSAVLADLARASWTLRNDRTVFADFTEKTIASGAITVTGPLHTVDTESNAASDDLETITAQSGAGELIHLKADNTARTVVIRHGTGNIKLSDAANFSLDDTEKSITLIRKGSEWHELARGGPVTGKLIPLYATTADSGNNDNASFTAFDQSYDLAANGADVGDVFVIEAAQSNDGGTRNMRLLFDSTTIFTESTVPTASMLRVTITITAVGASGALRYVLEHVKSGASPVVSFGTASSIDFTQAQTIAFQAQQTAGSESTHVLKSFRITRYRAP